MKAAWFIATRELRSFFVSPMAYVVLVAWMLLHGFSYYMLVGWYAQNASHGGSDTPISNFFGQTILFYLPILVFVPVLSMRLMAEERSRGTIEPLLTSPASNHAIVGGKYLAGLLIWTAMWLPTLIFVWLTANFGAVDWKVVAACYVGVFNIGLYYMAIGLWMSTISKNQVMAAVLTFVVLGMLFLVGMLRFVMPESADLLEYVSVWDQMGTASKGIIDSRNYVFGITVAAAALYFTARAVARFRNPGSRAERVQSLIASVLVLLIVGMVNYLSHRHHTRLDWTDNQRYSLSDRSVEVLGGLEQEIDIYVFISPSEPNFDDVRELLRSYTAETTQVEVHVVDPHRDETRYRMLLEQYGVRTAMMGGQQITDIAAVVAAGEDSWRITRDDILTVDFDPTSDQTPHVDVSAERAFTGAIIEATTGEPTEICVTEGHGEWTLEPSESRSLAPLREELRRDNVEMRTIRTLGMRESPEDCNVIFVVGPRTVFGDEEAAMLQEYLRAGGHLLLALDPVLDGERIRPTGLEELTRAVGIRVEDSVVFENSSELQLAGSPSAIGPFAVISYGEHEVTQHLQGDGAPSVFFEARSLSLLPEGGAVALASTSAESFARHEGLNPDMPTEALSGDDEGPLVLAAAGELASPESPDHEAPAGGKVVVVGDSDWIQGELLQNPQMVNFNLVNAAVGWLSDRDALIAIPPRSENLAALVMSEEDVSSIFVRVVIMIPLAFMLLGFSVWWSRRY